MANFKVSILFSTLLIMVLQLLFSPSEADIKGGYWYSESGLAVSDINASYFTHLFCAFADLDPNTNQVTISSTNAAQFSTFTQTVRANNPSVTTLLSIGGGGGGATLAAEFANMASQADSRKSFIDSSIQQARENNFDGLDLDWEYPSSDTDRSNLALLLREWRAAVDQESTTSGNTALILSAAVAGSDQISSLDYYPGTDITENLDFVNVMAYDLFTSDGYPTSTQPPAPWNNPQGQFSVDQGITTWIGLGVPASKLNVGLPFYGYKWQLADPNNHGLFAPATQGLGAVAYKDIVSAGAEVVFDSSFVTNYCFKGTDWFGYDDTESTSTKVVDARERGLLGYFAWHIGQDSNWALSEAAFNA
ncbi:unnamed protein product [Sphenostylis stenocarpa]|uniref:GH18 domain-containing protein n=1 Tax=Sphenostylis stenocarpa TaxID=92480 RepID=A0AA86W0V1_9FABA|nr:unnamed protein product [Sphenostylis stenocarpa]